jgi:hypothetical protein
LTAAQSSQLSQIHSDTQATGTLFELVSDIYSDTTAIEAGGGALTATQASQLTRVQSDLIVTDSRVLVIKSDVSDILSDTTIISSDTAAIETKTDSLTFTVAGVVDANIQRVNDVAVTGTGANGDEWGPA